MQHMVRRLVCLATVAGLSFGAMAYEDEYISTDGSPTLIDLGGDLVYVFSNKADVGVARTVTAQKPFTLKEALLVGGGGGGGAVLGGGGGGGQVLSLGTPTAIAADAALEVTVGAGGALDGWNGGKNGGHSKLVLPSDETHFAYGGGGGGGFNANYSGRPADVANEIGSGGGGQKGTASGSTKGTHYNYGNRGGSYQGGGGGAASPGENGGLHAETVLYGTETAYRKQAGYGGEGLTNFIVGASVRSMAPAVAVAADRTSGRRSMRRAARTPVRARRAPTSPAAATGRATRCQRILASARAAAVAASRRLVAVVAIRPPPAAAARSSCALSRAHRRSSVSGRLRM